MAVGQNQCYHFGVGAPPILVYFSGYWDVHWGLGVLTHGHVAISGGAWAKEGPFAGGISSTASTLNQSPWRDVSASIAVEALAMEVLFGSSAPPESKSGDPRRDPFPLQAGARHSQRKQLGGATVCAWGLRSLLEYGVCQSPRLCEMAQAGCW